MHGSESQTWDHLICPTEKRQTYYDEQQLKKNFPCISQDHLTFQNNCALSAPLA